MCENKKDCGCGCSIKKKSLTESKQILKEGTWAPTVWDKNVALQAKNILQGLIESGESNSVNISMLLKRFEKKFWNKIGDDVLYDQTRSAASEFEKKLPNWKNTILTAIQRIDQLEKQYVKENKLKESLKIKKTQLLEKIKLNITSSAKIELVKQTKIALDAIYTVYAQCERKDIEHNEFLDMVDKTFENISELLAVLISQESVEQTKK